MRQSVEYQVSDVLVSQSVVDMLASPAPHHDIFISQHPQALGDGGHSLSLGFRELRDASFTLSKQRNQPKT